MEIRSNTDIVRDLLQFALDREWSGQRNTSCHCHPTYEDACPECGSPEGEHEDGCKLATLILEAEAFLNAEDEIEERRSDRGEAVPHNAP